MGVKMSEKVMKKKLWFQLLIEAILKLFRPKPDEPEEDKIPDAIDPKEIVWLGEDVGVWEKKYSLKVSLSGDKIIYDQEGTSNWTPKHEAGVDATGNPWIITDEFKDQFQGKWLAATHEWMRKNQKVKGKRSVHGDHIKKREFGSNWTPTSGRNYGSCVSGLCRGVQRNESERTQIILFKWH
jgi:hypothetical protein